MENFKLIYDLTDKSKNYVQDQLNKYGAVCFWQEFKKHGYLSQWFSEANANISNSGSNKNQQFTGADLFDKRHANANQIFAFHNCEQYMMFQKASLFKDDRIKQKIIQEHNPKNIKKLGREVKNFNNETWNLYKEFVVYQGNLLKFSCNEDLKEKLLNTGNKVLIETSPFDSVYGIGLDYYGRSLNKQQFDLFNVDDWQGSNLLGFALMQVRDELKLK